MQLRDDSFVDMKFMTNDSGFTSRFFYNQIKDGKLPSPIKIGRSSRWKYRDYKNWQDMYTKQRAAP